MRVSAYMGVPWEDRGRGLDGCDCWGWVRLVLAGEAGVDLPLYGDYETAADRAEVAGVVSGAVGAFDPVPLGQERPGDLVLLRIAGKPCHIGVLLDGRRMAHMWPRAGVLLEKLDGPRWARRVDGYYRPRR
jgi:lipoprotein Spr